MAVATRHEHPRVDLAPFQPSQPDQLGAVGGGASADSATTPSAASRPFIPPLACRSLFPW